MKKWFIATLLLCTTYLSAASWLSAKVMNEGSSSGVFADVSLAYYPKIKKVVAAWANNSDNLPYYSVYDGIADTWTPATPIPTTIAAIKNVTLQSFPFKRIVVAAWVDNTTHLTYYSYFNGTHWSVTKKINATALAFDQIKMTYDKVEHRIIAAWAQDSPLHLPYYAIFDDTLHWSTPAQLDPTYGVSSNINLVYDKSTGLVVAALGVLHQSSGRSLFTLLRHL